MSVRVRAKKKPFIGKCTTENTKREYWEDRNKFDIEDLIVIRGNRGVGSRSQLIKFQRNLEAQRLAQESMQKAKASKTPTAKPTSRRVNAKERLAVLI